MRTRGKSLRTTRNRAQARPISLAEALESRVMMTITVQFSTYNLVGSPDSTTLAVNGWVGVLITAVSDNGKAIGGFDLDSASRGIYGNMAQTWNNALSSPTGTVPTSAAGSLVDLKDSYFSSFAGLGFSAIVPLAENNNGSSHAPAVNQKTSGDYTFMPLDDAGTANYGLGTRLNGAGAFTSNAATTLRIAFVIVPAGTNVQVIGQFADSTPQGFNINQSFLVPAAPNTVANKHLFYNNSGYDGNDVAANAADDNAIALDKQALPASGTASFANYSSYSKGINGIMVDMTALTGALTAADFEFKVGGASLSDTNPASWVAAPNPTAILARPGAGMGGSTRVELTWADNAIQKQWLQVVVKANANTGLAADTAFYFGNAIGDIGDSAANAQVNAVDEITTRANAADLTALPNAIVNVYDFNRDKLVDSADADAAGANYTFFLNSLQKITAPALPATLASSFTGIFGSGGTTLSSGTLALVTTSTTTSVSSPLTTTSPVTTLGTLTTIQPSAPQTPKKGQPPVTTRLVPQTAKTIRRSITQALKRFTLNVLGK